MEIYPPDHWFLRLDPLLGYKNFQFIDFFYSYPIEIYHVTRYNVVYMIYLLLLP